MSMHSHFTVAALVGALAARAAAQQAAQQAAPQAKPLDRANLDTTCAPCADFYRYANGGWIRRASIPAAYPLGTGDKMRGQASAEIAAREFSSPVPCPQQFT